MVLDVLAADVGPLAVTARRPHADFRALGAFNARTLALRPLRLVGGADGASVARAAAPIEFPPPGPDSIDHIVVDRRGGSGDPLIVTTRFSGHGVVECQRGGRSLGGFDAAAAPYVCDLDREPFWLGESVEDGAVLDFHVSDPPALALEGGQPVVYVTCRTPRDAKRGATPREAEVADLADGYDLLGLGEGVRLAAWATDDAAGGRLHFPDVSMRFWWWGADGPGWRTLVAPAGAPRIESWDVRGEPPRIHLVAGPRPRAALALWIADDGAIRGLPLERP